MGVRVAQRRSEAGFSLVEVAIALSIISIALVPTAQMWLAISQANHAIGQKAQALVVAQQVIERDVRAKPFSAQGPGTVTGLDASSGLRYELERVALGPGLLRAEARIMEPGQNTPLIRMVTLTAKEAEQ